MKKATKKTKVVEPVEVEVPEVEVPEVEVPEVEKELKINPFVGDFGRTDIDLLRDKVNEIVDYINNQ